MAPIADIYWTDGRLVKQVLAEDPRAFERLISRHQKRACAIARATGVRTADLEDVIEESFVRAFEKLRQLRSPGRFRPWLLEIVRNVARSTLRRNARREAAMSPSTEAREAELDSSADHVEQGELRAALWSQVSRLPESVREAIFLYYYEGQSVPEVARSLAITRAAVLKRLQRGREMLRERLWLELKDTVRDMMPSARASRLEARRLALLVIGATSLRTGAAQAAAGTAASRASGQLAASSSGSTVGKGTLNGALHFMTTKKLGLSLAVAALLISGALVVMISTSADRSPGSIAVRESATANGAKANVAPLATDTPADGEELTNAGATARDVSIGLTAPSIRGVVTDEESRGLAGASVLALPETGWRDAHEASARSIGRRNIGDPSSELRELYRTLAERGLDLARTETDEDGAFELRGLAAGEYRLLVGLAGFGPSVDTYVVVRDDEAARCRVELTAGRDVSGTVVDNEGRPITGARAIVSPTSWRRAQGRKRVALVLDDLSEATFLLENREGVTGEDGRFALAPLKLTDYDLTVTAEGYSVARVLVVPSGEDVHVVLSRGRQLEVVVTAVNSRGVSDSVVTLEAIANAPPAPALGPGPQPNAPEFVDLQTPAHYEATTDRSGHVTFEALEPGRYELTVTAEGYVSHVSTIELGAEDTREDVQLETGGTIVGVVHDDGQVPLDDVRVWIETSRPGGWIWWGNRYEEPVAPLSESRTGPDGRFVIDGLPDGAFTLNAAHRRYQTRRLVNVGRGDDLKIVLEKGETIRGVVRDGLDRRAVPDASVAVLWRNLPETEKVVDTDENGAFEIHGLDLERRGLSLETRHPDYPDRMTVYPEDDALKSEIEILFFRPERVIGRVVDGEGLPVAGAVIHMESNGERAPFPSGQVTVRSSDDGGFVVRAPSAKGQSYGGLEIVATSPPASIGRSGPLEIHASEVHEVEIVLEPASSLAGRVVDSAGNAVAGAVILAARKASENAEPSSRPRTTRSRDDGAYRLERLGPGVYVVEVRSARHARSVVPALEITNEPATLDVTLEDGRSIAGRVTDLSGNPVAGAQVLLLEPKDCDVDKTSSNRTLRRQRRLYDSGVQSTVTYSGGDFSLDRVPDETWTVVARAPGFAPSELTVATAEDESVELTLTRLSTVHGTVVEASTGRPVSYFRAMILTRNAEKSGGQHMLYREFSHPRGEFLLEGLLPVSYSIAIIAEGYGRKGFRVSVTEGSDQTVNVELEKGHALTGAIVDAATGEPIAGAHVMAFNWTRGGWRGDWRNHAVANTTTDEDGEFRLAGLEPARYSFNFSREGYLRESRKLKIGDSPLEPVRVALKPAGRLKGKLVGLSKRRFVYAYMVLEDVDDPSEEISQPIQFGKDDYSLDRIPAGKYNARLREQVVKPEREKAFYGGESINIEDDTFDRETPLGEVEIRAGETAELEVALPDIQ